MNIKKYLALTFITGALLTPSFSAVANIPYRTHHMTANQETYRTKIPSTLGIVGVLFDFYTKNQQHCPKVDLNVRHNIAITSEACLHNIHKEHYTEVGVLNANFGTRHIIFNLST